MKKKSATIKILGTLAMACLLITSGCGEGGQAGKEAAPALVEEITPDVDLTSMSSTIVYSEVYNMLLSPESYIGKTIKMRGAFAVYATGEGDQETLYYACLIADATACCSQGIEFVPTGDYHFPDDYPELGSEITVIGTFDTYIEDGYEYCTLRNASFC